MTVEIAKHYIREWERHPDLYAFPITTSDTLNGARHVAQLAAEVFVFPYPHVAKNCRRTRSLCVGYPDLPLETCHITLSASFTAGELLHELAHARCFSLYGDHDHGGRFKACMDDMCIWFRASEEAQKHLFP